MTPLRHLIAEAVALAGGNLCASGHDWQSIGGRRCPMGAEGCSQTVYQCERCGTYDYGEGADSPGRRDCQSVCGDSMTGWQGGALDPDADPAPLP